jgi:DNA-binding transcriptional ArsR family regulator
MPDARAAQHTPPGGVPAEIGSSGPMMTGRRPRSADDGSCPKPDHQAGSDRIHPDDLDNQVFVRAAGLAGLLAEPRRLRLLHLLCRGDHDVTALARLTEASVPLISHHLGKLRSAGLVHARRRGNRHIYAATRPELATVIELLLHHAEHVQPGARRSV